MQRSSNVAGQEPNALLVGGAAFACGLMLFSDMAVRPLIGHVNPKWATPTLIFGVATVMAFTATAFALIKPRLRLSIIIVLLATAFVFFTLKGLPVITDWSISKLDLSSSQAYWCLYGPGGGLLLLLPSAILTVVFGAAVFGMPFRDQWGGRLRMTIKDWTWGLGVAAIWIGLCACAALLVSISTGETMLAIRSEWSQYRVDMIINIFSNVYEEVLTRGFILQLTRKHLGNVSAMLWTGIVFAMMHMSDAGKVIFFCLFTWLFALAVIRSGSLWSGWIVHQASDMVNAAISKLP